uniref:Molybdenum cofactor sulfurase n=1 Tax=Macrostomum lignano TaxID=282301 RepID=A0A1I8I378_9PLAT
MDVRQLRQLEFPQLNDYVYLDHAGATLYSERQLTRVMQELQSGLYGNPHTQARKSAHTSRLVEEARNSVLKHFNTSNQQHAVIFTSGATAAVKILAESFQSGQHGAGLFNYLLDSHTSIVGMREVLRSRGFVVRCSRTELELESATSSSSDGRVLFALPAQCNFSGRKLDLSIVDRLKSNNKDAYVLLDAASFAATCPLDLTACSADFVCLSFYKMFGYPTGLGALIVRLDRVANGESVLKKAYFGGGTVQCVTACGLSNSLAAGCSRSVSESFDLAQYLARRLSELRHSDGSPVCRLYTDNDYTDWTKQGGIVAFNLVRCDGSFVGYSDLSSRAENYRIQLRVGCFCNVGACQRYLDITDEQLLANLRAGHVCGDGVDLVDGRPTGAVRASFGYMSDESDADALVAMVTDNFVITKPMPVLPAAAASAPLMSMSRDELANLCRGGQSAASKAAAESHWPHLGRIFLYPVKSCAAFEVAASWPVDRRGFHLDRHWMVVNESGLCLTMKREPRLSQIRPFLDLQRRLLILNSPISDQNAVVPMDAGHQTAALCLHSRVCGSRVRLLDCGQAAADWLHSVVGYPCRLVRQDGDRLAKTGEQAISLANEQQFLLLNEASVAHLLDCIGPESPLDLSQLVARFRANLVVRGCQPMSEESWTRLSIGGRQFAAHGVCTRCDMIGIDQDTGESTIEPMRTLSQMKGGALKFGLYVSATASDNTTDKAAKFELSVGDAVIAE